MVLRRSLLVCFFLMLFVFKPQWVGAQIESVWTAQYWNNQTMAGEPYLTEQFTASGLNYYNCNYGNTDFSARFVTDRLFYDGVYEIGVVAIKGVRIYIDQELTIDAWEDGFSFFNFFHIPFHGGIHHLEVELRSVSCRALMLNFGSPLTGAAYVTGTVYEADHVTPLPNAEVAFYATDFNGVYLGYIDSTFSDADGHFELELPSNVYRIAASAPSHITEFLSGKPTFVAADALVLYPGQVAHNINFSLDPRNALSGSVFQSDGLTPVIGATVSVFGEDYAGSYVGAYATNVTDGSGHFEFELPAGAYRLGVTQSALGEWFFDGHAALVDSESVIVMPGQNTEGIDIVIASGPVRSTVNLSLTLTGRPPKPDVAWSMPLHVIISTQPNGIQIVDTTVTTSTFGTFEIGGLPPGTYRIWVQATGMLGVEQVQTLVTGHNPIDLGELKEGDADGNNNVNIADFSILAFVFGLSQGDAGYDARADFNRDHVVNIADFSLLAFSFGQGGVAP